MTCIHQVHAYSFVRTLLRKCHAFTRLTLSLHSNRQYFPPNIQGRSPHQSATTHRPQIDPCQKRRLSRTHLGHTGHGALNKTLLDKQQPTVWKSCDRAEPQHTPTNHSPTARTAHPLPTTKQWKPTHLSSTTVVDPPIPHGVHGEPVAMTA